MPIEIKELIIQALIGKGHKTGKSAPIKKQQSQLDVADIVSKIIKNEKER